MTSSAITPEAIRSENVRLQTERHTQLLATLRDLRKQARAEIDRLIAFLDASDTYVTTELEDSCEDDGAQCEGGGGEEGCEDEGAHIEENEPWLGATDLFNQTLWAASGKDDREGDSPECLEFCA